jgi:hypothetical protein
MGEGPDVARILQMQRLVVGAFELALRRPRASRAGLTLLGRPIGRHRRERIVLDN